MRHSQPGLDAGMEKLGNLRFVGAFFLSNFVQPGKSLFVFSSIAWLNALAKSRASQSKRNSLDTIDYLQCSLQSHLKL